MTTTDLAPATRDQSGVLESVVIKGDLRELGPEERVHYYREVCRSLGLNPLTQPFQYITLSGRLTLYATRTATDQLRKVHGVSVFKLERELVGDIYTVTAYAQDKDGRHDSSLGAVFVGGLKGDPLANQMMRCETKAKRRVTLSLCGLGWPDESEVEAIAEAERTTIDLETGEILSPAEDAVVRARQGRLLETYGGLLSECRNAKLIPEDQVHLWVMPQQFDEDKLVERGKKLRAMLESQRKDPPSAPPHQPAPSSAGERGAPLSPRSQLWAENRELVRRAHELGVSGVPTTLNVRETDDVIVAANTELRGRIREKEQQILATVDFDQEAPIT